MQDGIVELEAPVTNGISRAITYAICVLSTAFAAWLVITAIRWW